MSSHQHGDGCGHESHGTDHEHDESSSLGPNDSLFQHIDRENVVALNANGQGSVVIKPWHLRMDEQEFLESDADEQMIIRIPFTGSVRLRSILLKTGPGGQTPSKLALFANADNMDFGDASEKTPTQEFAVVQSREVGEYAVMTAKFSNISSITLFFPDSQGADTSQIYYVGFLGSWTARKATPVITVYEKQANPADHKKIQGMDGMSSSSQT
ncbi:galactose-binding domain-like protein [Mycena floridula]|nr:galactose-binding domain-like protein [Mycena floridula]